MESEVFLMLFMESEVFLMFFGGLLAPGPRGGSTHEDSRRGARKRRVIWRVPSGCGRSNVWRGRAPIKRRTFLRKPRAFGLSHIATNIGDDSFASPGAVEKGWVDHVGDGWSGSGRCVSRVFRSRLQRVVGGGGQMRARTHSPPPGARRLGLAGPRVGPVLCALPPPPWNP